MAAMRHTVREKIGTTVERARRWRSKIMQTLRTSIRPLVVSAIRRSSR